MRPDYCTIDDVKQFFSAHGVAAFSDHQNDGLGDDTIVQDCIHQATDLINSYAHRCYNLDDLDGTNDPPSDKPNRLLKSWAVIIATRNLCLRRGNPPPESLEMDYRRLTMAPDGLLVLLGKCEFKLADVPRKQIQGVVFSNVTTDRRHPIDRIRVTPSNSSKPPETLEQKTLQQIIHYP